MCEGGAQFDYKKGGMVFIGTIPHDFNWNYGVWILTGTISWKISWNYLTKNMQTGL
jgi:hypothetical protein